MSEPQFTHLEQRPEISGATQRQLQELIIKDGWRLTPATMAHKITAGRWIAARHLLYISKIVAPAIAKGDARIILTMPARHGKSEFLSVNTPIWFLERWPERYVMTITYALELATDFSVKVRDTFLNEDLHDLLTTRISRTKMRADRFLTTKGGGLTAAGIGGPITGRGAHLMLIDDYIKNAEAALSDSQRVATWEWFKSTAYTRLEPGASLVILATRWDIRDLIAKVREDMPDENWQVINLPAIAEINDPLGRKVGEALWPERYDIGALRRIENALGSYWWSAMYQQNPKASMSGAELGDKLRIVPESEVPHYSRLRTLRAWDIASTKGGGDWTVGMKMAVDTETGNVYILDVLRFQKSPYGVRVMVRAAAEGDGAGVQIKMEQEPGSAGVTVIEEYETTHLKGFDFEGEKATGKIEVRATPFLGAVEAGNVYAVRADWNEAFKTELNGHPDGDHDDQITAGALGYTKLVRSKAEGLVWGRRTPRGDGRIQIPHPHTVQKATPGLVWRV